MCLILLMIAEAANLALPVIIKEIVYVATRLPSASS